jgi:hypothetical protein
VIRTTTKFDEWRENDYTQQADDAYYEKDHSHAASVANDGANRRPTERTYS